MKGPGGKGWSCVNACVNLPSPQTAIFKRDYGGGGDSDGCGGGGVRQTFSSALARSRPPPRSAAHPLPSIQQAENELSTPKSRIKRFFFI